MTVLTLVVSALLSGQAPAAPQPIIDVHVHAFGAEDFGPRPVHFCAPNRGWPGHDPVAGMEAYARTVFKEPDCARPLVSAADDASLRDRTIAELKRLNIVAVTSGSPQRVADWSRHAPWRIIPGIMFGDTHFPAVEELRDLHRQGRLKVLGEITTQYAGIAPNDPKLEPYYALAEELDIPVAIHMGLGPPAISYLGRSEYRIALSDPLALEDVLVRHPKLRLYVMHAGWPMSDRMIALMYAHPQVYVDVAVINWYLPKPEFQTYLKRMVDAGFGKRIMFGSDQMVWPDAIAAAVHGIESADFLNYEQKRDIFYNNAARFLRLKQ